MNISLQIGLIIGRFAATMFVLVLLPGIFRRMHWKINSVVAYVAKHRSNFGKSVYILVFFHWFFVRFLPLGVADFQVFEKLGFLAFLLLTPLFLTSNKWAYKTLGKNWKKLHKLVYVIAWVIFLHTVLNKISLFSILLLITAVLEVVSLIKAKKEQHALALSDLQERS